MQTWVTLPFADGEYQCFLGPAQISEIEKKCDAGIGRIYGRTLAGRYGLAEDEALPENADYRFSELVEVVRQALIGGAQGNVDGVAVKVDDVRANSLIRNYILSGPDRQTLRKTWAFAAHILSALIEGYDPGPNDDAGKSPAIQTSGSTTQEP